MGVSIFVRSHACTYTDFSDSSTAVVIQFASVDNKQVSIVTKHNIICNVGHTASKASVNQNTSYLACFSKKLKHFIYTYIFSDNRKICKYCITLYGPINRISVNRVYWIFDKGLEARIQATKIHRQKKSNVCVWF